MVIMKCGLEIHQQLDSHKLFCKCPSILRNDTPDFEIKRKLHAVRGESGEVDVAAEFETSLDKEFIYQGYYDTTCLVEIDESPPLEINKEALEIALHICIHLNCEIIPITQIMRKIVIDGSNTTGFQRTVLIGRNGFVETKSGKVRIATVMLEEDAARIIEKNYENENKKEVVFRVDRLGIPLVEIATEADIKSPEQCKEVALLIGDILRSCKVKRGIGTIRQDINISITGHPRVEIKGFQDVKMFIPVIENEIKRQEENLKKFSSEELKSEVRCANPDGTTNFLRPMPGSARMYPETDLPLLYITRDVINKAKKTLPKLRSDVRVELERRGLSKEMIKLLNNEEKIKNFEALLKILNDPNFVAKVLFIFPKEIASHRKISESDVNEILNIDMIEIIVDYVSKGKIKKEETKQVMERIVDGEKLEDAIKSKIEVHDLESEIAKIIKEKPGLGFGAYMGLIMEKFNKRVSGKEASEILKKLLK